MAAPVVSMVLNQLGTFFREEIEKEVRMVVGAEKEIQKLVLGAKEEIEKLEVTLTAIQAVLYDADKKQVQDQRVKLWLERLTEGSIEISGLWGVKSANEAKEVHLANKRGIHALTLDFATTHSWVSREFINLSEGVLEGLQPHPNLEELKINQYPGSKLPSWMMSDLAPMYSKLRTLELMNLTQCTSTTLPSLGRLPMLEVLKIEGMKSVRRLGLDFLGISDIEEEEDNNATSSINSGQLIAFPSLIQLELSSMGELEEWVLPFERSDTLQIMPRLRILTIYYAPKLKMLPALGRLESLEALSIGGLHLVKRIGPEFFGISEDDDVRMKSVRRLGLDFLGILDIEEENDDATSSINREKLVVLPNLIELVLEKIWELEEWVLPFERSDTLQIMPCLRILTIYYAPKLKVPALGRLESRPNRLTDFILTSSSWKTIDGLHSLKRIGPEFFGISEDDVTKGTGGSSRGGESLPIIVFPKLKKLRFRFTHDWEEWEMMMPSWRQDASFIMPRLECLELWFCQKLKVVPHNIFSYQRVKERIEGCLELNQRSGMNQIIKRREVGESTGKMALFRRLFNRKLPNQLLEISERVYGDTRETQVNHGRVEHEILHRVVDSVIEWDSTKFFLSGHNTVQITDNEPGDRDVIGHLGNGVPVGVAIFGLGRAISKRAHPLDRW
ncbi:hypothetical protein GIB67_011001 [Kingdonia uniflora]|uniref:R13L1/DRL21-like LRR repeat region domain-containing protein n=1 Tax=Kingdonia uniflora TaxID=39325 RepID=A0A7J7P0J9_9MAGN|nr:hypothetical protein GIB67_011001 [Kingdonia uniflora]